MVGFHVVYGVGEANETMIQMEDRSSDTSIAKFRAINSCIH